MKQKSEKWINKIKNIKIPPSPPPSMKNLINAFRNEKKNQSNQTIMNWSWRSGRIRISLVIYSSLNRTECSNKPVGGLEGGGRGFNSFISFISSSLLLIWIWIVIETSSPYPLEPPHPPPHTYKHTHIEYLIDSMFHLQYNRPSLYPPLSSS